jgi:anti-anti-sigma factor
VRFAVSSSLKEVRRAVDLATEFCARHAIAERDVNAIAVALDEVLSNVISHGLHHCEGHEISVSLEYTNEVMSVAVEDDGAPFDPTQVPEPALGPGLAQRTVGGLGLVFVRALTDSLEYRRVSDRNSLLFRKRMSAGRAPAKSHASYRLSDAASGAAGVVTVEGRLDSEFARLFRDQMQMLIRDRSARLAVDVGQVSYIGSAGIWVLIAAENHAASLGGGLAIFGLSPENKRLFERTGIVGVLRICDTREEALARLAQVVGN